MEAALEAGEPFDPETVPAFLLPSNENDYYRGATAPEDRRQERGGGAGQGVVLGHAGGQRRRPGLRLVPLPRRRRQPDQEPDQPQPPGRGLQPAAPRRCPERRADRRRLSVPLPQDIERPRQPPVGNVNDVASSMGVAFSPFTRHPDAERGIVQSGANASGVRRRCRPTCGTAAADPIPLFQGLRRVEPRNTPTLFAATLNFDNFWDGRARHDFNGGSVFGAPIPRPTSCVDDGGGQPRGDPAAHPVRQPGVAGDRARR